MIPIIGVEKSDDNLASFSILDLSMEKDMIRWLEQIGGKYRLVATIEAAGFVWCSDIEKIRTAVKLLHELAWVFGVDDEFVEPIKSDIFLTLLNGLGGHPEATFDDKVRAMDAVAIFVPTKDMILGLWARETAEDLCDPRIVVVVGDLDILNRTALVMAIKTFAPAIIDPNCANRFISRTISLGPRTLGIDLF